MLLSGDFVFIRDHKRETSKSNQSMSDESLWGTLASDGFTPQGRPRSSSNTSSGKVRGPSVSKVRGH